MGTLPDIKLPRTCSALQSYSFPPKVKWDHEQWLRKSIAMLDDKAVTLTGRGDHKGCETSRFSHYLDYRLPDFFVIPFYLQLVLVHSANCVKTCIQWHVEECSLALLCNQ
jgi:hypothetical protein